MRSRHGRALEINHMEREQEKKYASEPWQGFGKGAGQPYHAQTMVPHTFDAGGGMTRTVHATDRAAAKKKLGPPDIH